MTDLQFQVIAIGCFGVLCTMVGWWGGWFVTRNQWRDDMIERGHARYNWKDGKWYWNENDPKVDHPYGKAKEGTK